MTAMDPVLSLLDADKAALQKNNVAGEPLVAYQLKPDGPK